MDIWYTLRNGEQSELLEALRFGRGDHSRTRLVFELGLVVGRFISLEML